jgi:hypothetical protein
MATPITPLIKPTTRPRITAAIKERRITISTDKPVDWALTTTALLNSEFTTTAYVNAARLT